MKGKTPVIKSTGSWAAMSLTATLVCVPAGSNPAMLLKTKKGSVKKEDVLVYLKLLKRWFKGKGLLLFWDGLAAHRAKVVKEYLKTQKRWLRVEKFPAYAPELNPVEYFWAAMKNKHVCNLRPQGLPALDRAVKSGKHKIAKDKELMKGFLKASKLY
ncbi:MAG: transposase [Minisyncoccales bacterium]